MNKIKAAYLSGITSLLDNMPAMSFAKDAETGVYVACNQEFAEYAMKKSPEEIAGLTDRELFEEDVAKHFMEKDRQALAMDRPYIFYEDVPAPDGTLQHLRTTKLKYMDDRTGRLRLMGMYSTTRTGRCTKTKTA